MDLKERLSWKTVALVAAPVYIVGMLLMAWAYRSVSTRYDRELAALAEALDRCELQRRSIVPQSSHHTLPADHRFLQKDAQLGKPAPGELRLVALGDSFVEGWDLKEAARGTGWRMVNRGIGGQFTDELQSRLAPDVLDLGPQAVLIEGGANDLINNVRPDEIFSRLAGLVEGARAAGARVLLATVPQAGPGFLPPERLAKFNKEADVVNRTLESYCGSGRCALYRMDRALEKDGRFDPALHKDPLHPNAAGYREMSKALRAALKG